jgi:hypothetical protein
MNRMSRMVCVAIACAIALTGCSVKKAGWSGDAARLVYYAKSVPLYPGAKFDDAMGSDTYGDEPDSHFEGTCVWFKVDKYDKEKVLTWYEQNLPGAVRNVDEAGTVVLTVTPQNAEAGENMGVYIDNDGFRVFEHTKPGKHKA